MWRHCCSYVWITLLQVLLSEEIRGKKSVKKFRCHWSSECLRVLQEWSKIHILKIPQFEDSWWYTVLTSEFRKCIRNIYRTMQMLSNTKKSFYLFIRLYNLIWTDIKVAKLGLTKFGNGLNFARMLTPCRLHGFTFSEDQPRTADRQRVPQPDKAEREEERNVDIRFRSSQSGVFSFRDTCPEITMPVSFDVVCACYWSVLCPLCSSEFLCEIFTSLIKRNCVWKQLFVVGILSCRMPYNVVL